MSPYEKQMISVLLKDSEYKHQLKMVIQPLQKKKPSIRPIAKILIKRIQNAIVRTEHLCLLEKLKKRNIFKDFARNGLILPVLQHASKQLSRGSCTQGYLHVLL